MRNETSTLSYTYLSLLCNVEHKHIHKHKSPLLRNIYLLPSVLICTLFFLFCCLLYFPIDTPVTLECIYCSNNKLDSKNDQYNVLDEVKIVMVFHIPRAIKYEYTNNYEYRYVRLSTTNGSRESNELFLPFKSQFFYFVYTGIRNDYICIESKIIFYIIGIYLLSVVTFHIYLKIQSV
jgi:hypothetical protein